MKVQRITDKKPYIIKIGRNLERIEGVLQKESSIEMISLFLYLKLNYSASRIRFKNFTDLRQRLSLGYSRLKKITNTPSFDKLFRYEDHLLQARAFRVKGLQMHFRTDDCKKGKAGVQYITIERDKQQDFDYIKKQVEVALFYMTVYSRTAGLYREVGGNSKNPGFARLEKGIMSYNYLKAATGFGRSKTIQIANEAIKQGLVEKSTADFFYQKFKTAREADQFVEEMKKGMPESSFSPYRRNLDVRVRAGNIFRVANPELRPRRSKYGENISFERIPSNESSKMRKEQDAMIFNTLPVVELGFLGNYYEINSKKKELVLSEIQRRRDYMKGRHEWAMEHATVLAESYEAEANKNKYWKNREDFTGILEVKINEKGHPVRDFKKNEYHKFYLESLKAYDAVQRDSKIDAARQSLYKSAKRFASLHEDTRSAVEATYKQLDGVLRESKCHRGGISAYMKRLLRKRKNEGINLSYDLYIDKEAEDWFRIMNESFHGESFDSIHDKEYATAKFECDICCAIGKVGFNNMLAYEQYLKFKRSGSDVEKGAQEDLVAMMKKKMEEERKAQEEVLMNYRESSINTYIDKEDECDYLCMVDRCECDYEYDESIEDLY